MEANAVKAEKIYRIEMDHKTLNAIAQLVWEQGPPTSDMDDEERDMYQWRQEFYNVV